MKAEHIANMTDDQLIKAAEFQVQAYPNCSDCNRILAELLNRHTKLQNIADDLMK